MKIISFIILAVISPLTFFPACATGKKKGESKIGSSTGANVESSGDNKTAAKIVSQETKATVEIPAGSKVTLTESANEKPGNLVIEVSRDSSLNILTKKDDVTGSVSYAPATEMDKAVASSVKAYYLAGLLFGVGGVLLVYMGHGKAAVISGVGALVVPIAGRLLGSDAALKIGVGVGCVSLTLFAAYYFMVRKYDLDKKVK